ncbi:hypothetical protein A2239_00255 [Candidatus Uhrbacteria bacterium RIFOXYA2_FULL_40_9]|nr:MAG: hypothetical protein A2239_00255 [Candidatus Uhrbacteria bacterium RIFOXYA2_FULL_40_9]OGL97560.1 MAG: hypothetical protein A2332_03430 [Candidatus Uhrbacteria bacterium RIFOXYB2_FULL_41_18]
MDDQTHLLAGLEAFGLDKKEAVIYLAGLRLGPSSVLEISRQTHLPRTTIYPILEKLRERGVFRAGKTKKKNVYTAEDPGVLDRKLKERQTVFSQIAPDLEVIHEMYSGTPTMTFYEGTEGFKRMWKRLYRSGVTDYKMITTGIGMLEYVKEPYLLKGVIAERLEKGIRSFQLIPETSETRKIVKNDHKELRESRFLPKDVSLPATIIIFGDEVAFMTTRKENAMILVASGDVAVSCRTLFDLLWQVAKMPESEEEVWGTGGA